MRCGSRGPVPAPWSKWLDVVTMQFEGKPCSALPVIPRNCVALRGPQDCLSALKTLYFHCVASGVCGHPGGQGKVSPRPAEQTARHSHPTPPHELVASPAGRPLGRQRPKALELACACVGGDLGEGETAAPPPLGSAGLSVSRSCRAATRLWWRCRTWWRSS